MTIYERAQAAFEKMDAKKPTAPQGKVFQMGYMDGYLDGFREAKKWKLTRWLQSLFRIT